MPIIKSAKKALRQTKRKTIVNQLIRSRFKTAVAAFRKKPDIKKLPQVFSVIDKAAKKNVIHKKKADRLKSRLSQLLPKK